MNYEDYVTENSINNLLVKRKDFYFDTNVLYPYDLLLIKTIEDIKKWKKL